MAYRSFKELLGETSLERKCRFLFGLCLLVLITGSFWWYGSRTKELVFTTTRSTGRHLVDAVMINYHWKKLEADKKYTNPIETLGKMLQNQHYSWRILSPDASAEERASYTRLDAAMIDVFVGQPAPGTLEVISRTGPGCSGRVNTVSTAPATIRSTTTTSRFACSSRA